MRSTVMVLALAAAFLAIAATTNAQQNKAEKLYQEALYQMEGLGDYTRAIELFNRVVTEFAKDKPIGAKALLHVGVCYEKLGKSEAQKAYERVIKEFADQREVVAEARARLSALTNATAAKPAMSVRQVWAGPFADILGAPSPDGRYIAVTDWETGNLAIRETATGAMRRLTDNGNWHGWAQFPVPSPDGKHIAYSWFNDRAQFDLRVFSLDTSSARVVYATDDQVTGAQPVAWTPDGKSILTVVARADQTVQIAFVSVDNGSARVLKTFHDWRSPEGASLSPDGRYVVYDLPRKQDSPGRDIFILSADGKLDAPLVEHPADNVQPMWTPDGKQVIFVSNRTGRLGIWAIPVADGKVQGPPELVRADVPPLRAMGFTRDGAFYYSVRTGMTDVYLAALDPKTGAVLSEPTASTQRFVGTNRFPDWSPDGKFLLYISQRGAGLVPLASGRKIVVRSLVTGEDREITPKLVKFERPPRWSPDGRFFLVHGDDSQGQAGFFKVNAQTGEASLVLREEPPGMVQEPAWSPDGRTIFYLRLGPVGEGVSNRLRARNLETGADREVYGAAVNNFAVAPDGRWIVASNSQKGGTLAIFPVQGGESRVLTTLKETEFIPGFSGMAWTPDEKYILFTKARPDGALGPFELWRISAEGGTPQKLGIAMEQLRELRVHPDGQRIAFSAGQNKQEVWVMENFLPKEEISAKYTAPLIRQVWAGTDVDIIGSISLDGRYLTFVDWETGDLAIREVVTGKNRRVTNKGSWFESSEFALFSVFSPDGKQIAYGWFYDKDRQWQLRIINVDGSEPRTLYHNKEVEFIQTFDWSPDGEYILLAISTKKDAVNQIVTVSVANGSARVLKTGPYPQKMSFSRDGRYIAYDFPPQENSPNRDIYLLSADGSRDIALVEHPADDFLLGWSSDGKTVLFASNRTGTVDAWALQVREGMPAGSPELVKKDVGRVVPMGFTQNGSFYYGLQTGMKDISLAELDASGKIISQPKKITQRFVGSNSDPAWSPDGKFLAYISKRHSQSAFGSNVLCILSLDGGTEREITPKLRDFHYPRWSFDSRSVFVRGVDKKGHEGLFEIDLQKGELTAFFVGHIMGAPAFSPDGSVFYYYRMELQPEGIVKRDLKNGHETDLVAEFARNLALSPDGAYLAYSGKDGSEKSLAIKIIPTAGGKPRELIRLNQEVHPSIAWTTDGRYILYTKRHGDESELWRVLLQGGEPEQVGLAMNGLDHIRVHPDGKQIAFSAGEDKEEVWVMENLLPKEERGQK